MMKDVAKKWFFLVLLTIGTFGSNFGYLYFADNSHAVNVNFAWPKRKLRTKSMVSREISSVKPAETAVAPRPKKKGPPEGAQLVHQKKKSKNDIPWGKVPVSQEQ